ncbi:FecCD family ABC transporter permease [Gracilibacillus thailandensis]|uniref:Iron chelate uptake ABC transporter family permease subunit n=1 Tax=Gracilibacillus thailandensis TaxID=563735 RepID=A0A6N7QXT5_9BACI|nr:iron ABC transporter permease [Gracilibacillus thailandensis]MRI66867.1 iron chelate uptake ABC transporter family permease subunit [Gracilibacillus thailandensis]
MTNKQWKTTSQLKKERQVKLTALLLFILISVCFFISLNTGHIRLSPQEKLITLFGQGTEQQSLILFDFRLPRMVIAILVGMGLAVSGAVLQGIVRNPLAEPGIIGINAGAGLAVMLFISFFATVSDAPVFVMPIIAFIGAGGAALIIYILSYKRHEGISPIRLVLTGIAIAAGIDALMIVLTLRLDPDNYQFLATWIAGSIWGSNWKFVLALLPWLLVFLPFIYSKSSVLNILTLGDETAIGLGAHMEKERRILLILAVIVAAACVSVSGGIGFVGLIAPHLTRRLVGDKHEYIIPISAMVGGLLLLVADTLGRWMMQPSEIPAGIIVAVIGAPYFLYLLAKTKD